MIDRAYKNYFAELNSLDSQSKKLKKSQKELKILKFIQVMPLNQVTAVLWMKNQIF